jgi:predicted nucleic acid-binding protein
MARYFLDTSAVIKLYRSEPNSPAIVSVVGDTDRKVIAGTMPVEYRSALGVLVRKGELSAVNAVVLVRGFEADRSQFQPIALNGAVLGLAESLLDVHAVTDGLRALDAIQLASALAAHLEEPIDALVTTDKTLARLAIQHGLTVLP